MRDALISIIVPVYNVEPYIRRCLDSVINQTYKNLEIILIDDGSTDKSGVICDEYKKMDNRIIVIHQKNQGLSAARNAGLDIFKGEYVSFVDSDDWVDKKFIETLYNLAISNDANMSASSYFISLDDKVVDYKYIIYNEVDVAWGKLYKSYIFKNIKFPAGKLYEDRYVYAQVAYAAKRIACTSKNLYHYELRGNSITARQKHKITFDSEISILFSLRFLSTIDIEKSYISQSFTYVIYRGYNKILFNKIKKKYKKEFVSDLRGTYKNIKDCLSTKTKINYHFPYFFVVARKIKIKTFNVK